MEGKLRLREIKRFDNCIIHLAKPKQSLSDVKADHPLNQYIDSNQKVRSHLKAGTAAPSHLSCHERRSYRKKQIVLRGHIKIRRKMAMNKTPGKPNLGGQQDIGRNKNMERRGIGRQKWLSVTGNNKFQEKSVIHNISHCQRGKKIGRLWETLG